MQSVYNLNSSRAELDLINNTLRDSFAEFSDENLNICSFTTAADLMNSILEELNINIACVDVAADRGIEAAELIRKENKQAKLIVVADTSISPVSYLKPSITASSLLLRPLNADFVTDTVKEVFKIINNEEKTDSAEAFVLKTQGINEYLEYDKILYFEARNKRVYVNTKRREIPFYSTIEKLEGELPPNFVRCHRSFIVNTDKIERIEFSNDTIILENEIYIPISRSYKSLLKNIK